MKRRFAFALLTVALQGCVTCRFDYDENREVKIVEFTPHDGWHTGSRQRFGIQVNDSFGEPKELTVSVDIDQRDTRWCEGTPTKFEDHSVDRQRRPWMTEPYAYNFWCPVEAEELAAGAHKLRYRVWNRDGDVAAEQTAAFTHHPAPPVLTVDHAAVPGGERVVWSADGDDVREITVHIGALRILTSHQPAGEAVLDASLLPPGRPLRVRAFDLAGNFSEEVIRR